MICFFLSSFFREYDACSTIWSFCSPAVKDDRDCPCGKLKERERETNLIDDEWENNRLQVFVWILAFSHPHCKCIQFDDAFEPRVHFSIFRFTAAQTWCLASPNYRHPKILHRDTQEGWIHPAFKHCSGLRVITCLIIVWPYRLYSNPKNRGYNPVSQ